MTIRKAPQTYAALRTTGKTALLLLAAWCGSALASNDIKAPCPELVSHDDACLHDILDEDATAATLRTLDAIENDSTDDDEPSDEATVRNTVLQDVATRLPGVATSDRPRFRRQMFRTDI